MPILLNSPEKDRSSLQILSEDEGSEPIDSLIKINHEFAKKFEERKCREELQHLSEKYEKKDHLISDNSDTEDESDQSSSEEEEDPIKELSNDVNLIKTLAKIKAKDDSIYDTTVDFFAAEKVIQKNEQNKVKSDYPLTLKKYSHDMLASGAFLKADEEDDQKEAPMTYTQELDALRSAVIKASSLNEEEEGDLFSVTKSTEKTNEDLYKKAVIEAISKETMKAWIAPKKSPREPREKKNIPENNEEDAEAFLASYILNRGWSYPKKKESKMAKAMSNLDSDVEELEKAEEFEVAFNRRFEDDASQLVGHSRIDPSSVRQSGESRISARKAKLDRRQAKEKTEVEELKRLKVLKRREIEKKAEEVALLSGHSTNSSIKKLLEEELEDSSSFDETEHDTRMAALFNNEYYDGEDSVEMEQDANENEKKAKKSKNKNVVGVDVSDVLKKEIARLEDEYFNLHYEDKIAGNITTRFKYTSVIPSSFGLKAEDILTSEDKDLNKFISLKKLRPYREEEEQRKDAERYSRKRVYKRFYFQQKK